MIDKSGALKSVSLLALLRSADDLRSVVGGSPGEQVALIEFLLAICYASGTYPDSSRQWLDRVDSRHPLDEAADWLADEADDRWDLFHPDRPLGQNALLAPFLDRLGTGPAQLVIEHAGDYNQFFDHHHLEHPTPLPAAKAFRALLTQHVYGLPGRARISGKETLGPAITYLSAGRLGGRIRVVALGETVAETLRLNLAPMSGGPGDFNYSWTTGPVGRRAFDRRPPGRAVTGPADLHSYLGRSVVLRPAPGPDGTGVVVDRVLIGAGELLELDPDLHLQDAVFVETRDGERKPLWPSPTRALWRDAHALYAAVTDQRQDLYGRLALLSRTSWPGTRPISLLAVGLVANKTTPISWVSGHFPFAPSLTAELHLASYNGSGIAEHVARSLNRAAYAAWEIAYPNPKPSDRTAQLARFDARGEHWQATEEPFHILLEDTADSGSPQAPLLAYARTLSTAAHRFLTKRLDSMPRNAQGSRARSIALRRLDDELYGPSAPAELREVRP
ncbi:type I-E CRISPR-associated protein Cse1/CasA [Kitasatospora sp. NPDC059463]|uniref:type I-E CRISPR-associated protein Cse1/CasA n=1 Tax=unclassified Kitasatospora TaxID=2633591 RepID=UPI0036B5C798